MRLKYTSNWAKLVIIAEFFLVSYLLYTLTVSVYKSYQIDVHINNFEEENARIEEENRIKSEEFDYYSSNAYMEKIAKQNLGLINPGEEVIIIPKSEVESGSMDFLALEEDEGEYGGISNPQKWWRFFFESES
ncbi:septum formation initiator family protein [Pseudomonadota bacterium]